MKFIVTYFSEVKYGNIYRFNKKWFRKTPIGSIPYNIKYSYDGLRAEFLENHKKDDYVAVIEPPPGTVNMKSLIGTIKINE